MGLKDFEKPNSQAPALLGFDAAMSTMNTARPVINTVVKVAGLAAAVYAVTAYLT